MVTAKWFPKLKYSTSARVAARRVLAARVRLVDHYSKLVMHGPREDPEHVHQLRVATRRLAAAISVFRECLDFRVQNELRLAARRLRRAASKLRDLDVQMAMLESRVARQSGADSLAAIWFHNKLRNRRRRAEITLLKAIPKCLVPFRKASHQAIQMLASHRIRTKGVFEPMGVTANGILRKRLRHLNAAWQTDLGTLDNLHKLRIAAKRLRYAMEIFAACFPIRQHKLLYARVESIQADLGDINDLRNLIATVTGLERAALRIRRLQNGESATILSELRTAVERDVNLRIAEFLGRWPSARWCELRRRFKQMLKRPLKSIPGRSVGQIDQNTKTGKARPQRKL